MTFLAEIIKINEGQTDAAIDFTRDLSRPNLISGFSPTKSTIKVFEHINDAVQPGAKQQQRAMNLYGAYGSGKSHLAVVLAQLLQHGCDAPGCDLLLEHIEQFASTTLAQSLKNTFLASTDKDARPYLVVYLNGRAAASIPDALMENLCDALKRHPSLNLETILPKTEYEACISCFNDMVLHTPELEHADLPSHLAIEFQTTHQMFVNLSRHNSLALKTFKEWYSHIVYGQTFNPANHGGKTFIEAYVEAGKNLAQQHHFGGIVVIWDEFGFALEDLLTNPVRSAQQEIKALESFVQTACSPDLGHTIFMGLTHVSFTEYADRAGASEIEKGYLEQISGRFARAYKIELNAAESEGYHLLGMQRNWTELGKEFLTRESQAKKQILEFCQQLPLFNQLGNHLNEVLLDVYPLHPITAAGLFALSGQAAQNNRTALTFFRDNASNFMQREISESGLFHDELIRLPILVDYFEKSLNKLPAWERYQRAEGQIPTTLIANEQASKKAILKLCLLAQLLGEQFQTTEHFLSIALYDSDYSSRLIDDLAFLKGADLLWKNDVTEQWTLSGDSGIDIEGEIEKERRNFTGQSPRQLFENYPDMREDLLPHLGEHDLEPSKAGIVRSYQVDLLFPPITNTLKINNPLHSAQIYFVFAKDNEEAETVKTRIKETPEANIFFWLPLSGIRAEKVTIDGKSVGLSELLGRYLSLERLQKQSSISDEFRRQLNAKSEKNRQQLLVIFQTLFGREGLNTGKSQLIQAGSCDALPCQSWHDFRHYLGDVVQKSYPKEIPIRAMNMNRLIDEKGRRNKLDIVDRILKFEQNPDYQDDLLGDYGLKRDGSSELAALIDGILGANNLFIQRNTGWDIKKTEETEGKIKAVLKLIHSKMLKKRDIPFQVNKLTDELIAPPFGIPACNLSILAAVAIRHEVKRLRWSGKETDFAKNLTEAFDSDSKLTIKLFEFNSKQVTALTAVGEYFSLLPKFNHTLEEHATQCCFKLRDFVKAQPDAVKQSGMLNDKAQKLIKFFDLVGKSQQDIAEFFIELLEISNKTNETITIEAPALIKELLDNFAKVENAKRFEIDQSWIEFQKQIETDRANLILRLTHDRASNMARKIGALLENTQHVSTDDLTQSLLNKPFEDCSDIDIGRCQTYMETHVDYHPPSLPQPPILPPPTFFPPVAEPPIISIPNAPLIDILRQKIESMPHSRSDVKQALEELLIDYRD